MPNRDDGSLQPEELLWLKSEVGGLYHRVKVLSIAVACQVMAVLFNIALDILYMLLDISGRWPMVVVDVISGIIK